MPVSDLLYCNRNGDDEFAIVLSDEAFAFRGGIAVGYGLDGGY